MSGGKRRHTPMSRAVGLSLAMFLLWLPAACDSNTKPAKSTTASKPKRSAPSEAVLGYWNRTYPEAYTGKQQVTESHWIWYFRDAEPSQRLTYDVVARSKRQRKLVLRDRISFVEDQLTPDIIA